MAARPRFWFIPCMSGDFRLTDLDEKTCRLTVEDPTPSDYATLQPFLATMVEMNWLDPAKAKIKEKGLTVIDLRIDIGLAGPLLVGQVHAKGDTWTAVRSVQGQISVNDGTSLALDLTPGPTSICDPLTVPCPYPPCRAEKGAKCRNPQTGAVREVAHPTRITAANKHGEPQLPAPLPVVEPVPLPPEPVAAATFQPPARGCPPATACERRSSEVLRTFCTAAQWASWQHTGRMKVIGNYTGIRYDLYHRDEAAARGFRHTLIAPLPDDVSYARRWGSIPPREVCVWRTNVPPEEEALAIKMAVEHREHWLLSDSDGNVTVPAAGEGW